MLREADLLIDSQHHSIVEKRLELKERRDLNIGA
jgi:hypothetical protein